MPRTNRLHLLRPFRPLRLLNLGLALALVLTATASFADLTSAVGSRVGRVLLTETRAGSRLAEQLLGRSFRGTSDDVARLVSRVRASETAGLEQELESRLRWVETRFRAETGRAPEARITAVTAGDRALLQRLADDFLVIRVGGGRIEFAAPPTGRGYGGARDAFLHGTPEAAGSAVVRVTGPEAAALRRQYGLKPDDPIFVSPKNGWKGVVRGMVSDGRMAPELTGPILQHPGAPVDEVIVGGGPAGLTSGIFLTDGGHRVLILEAAPKLGGLATGDSIGGARFGSGAAYYSAPARPQFRLFQRLGLNNYTRVNGIERNIDSLILDGKLYPEFWEEPTIEMLPRSFKLYKHWVERMEARGFVANQPIEEAPDLWLDTLTAKEAVDRIPEMVSQWKDPASRALYREFLADPRIDPRNPMKDLYAYLDPYSRSALGATTDQINAMAFFNFQTSEIAPRYTGPTGTGEITDRMTALLARRPRLASMQTSSPVARITVKADHVEVVYVRNGRAYAVKARNVVFTAPMKVAPRLIEGFESIAPRHAEALRSIPYTDYIVTNIQTNGQVTRGSYDFWFGNTDNSRLWPTDLINGRFQELGGAPPRDNVGVLTVYQPIGEGGLRNFTPEAAFARAEEGIEQAMEMAGPTIRMQWGQEIRPQWVIANAYPASIQVVKPGYFRDIAPVFRQPIAGRIYTAGIVNGTPSLEEALYSGQRAAEEIVAASPARPRPR